MWSKELAIRTKMRIVVLLVALLAIVLRTATAEPKTCPADMTSSTACNAICQSDTDGEMKYPNRCRLTKI